MVSGSFGSSFQMPPPAPELPPAAQYYQKNSLQLTSSDSSEIISFTQAGSQTGANVASTGNPWKFQSDANRPALGQSLFNIRQGAEETASYLMAQNVILAYQNLLSKLPTEVGEWMNEQIQLEKERQNTDYIAFSTMLNAVAYGIAKLEILSHPVETEVSLQLNANNMSLPRESLIATINTTNEITNYLAQNRGSVQ